jgi:thiol-disulfide isomerase/thioredoxin
LNNPLAPTGAKHPDGTCVALTARSGRTLPVDAAVILIACFWLSGLSTSASAGKLESIEDPTPRELSGKTLDGLIWHLEDSRGRVVLVNFWAGWCSSCLDEMPGLNRLNARMRGQPFVMVSVNVGEPERRVSTLVHQLGIETPVLLDPDSAAFASWGATVLPTTYLLDGEGRRRLVGQGSLDWDDPQILKTIEGLVLKHGEVPSVFPLPRTLSGH